MTYNVFGGTLNLAQFNSVTTLLFQVVQVHHSVDLLAHIVTKKFNYNNASTTLLTLNKPSRMMFIRTESILQTHTHTHKSHT